MKAKRGYMSKRRAKIAKRDKWICQLCFELIQSPGDLTVDHTIPVSKGGTDAWANCVSAHKECNSAKGDSTGPMPPEYYKKRRADKIEADNVQRIRETKATASKIPASEINSNNKRIIYELMLEH